MSIYFLTTKCVPWSARFTWSSRFSSRPTTCLRAWYHELTMDTSQLQSPFTSKLHIKQNSLFQSKMEVTPGILNGTKVYISLRLLLLLLLAASQESTFRLLARSICGLERVLDDLAHCKGCRNWCERKALNR
jgi:hypothetical protein